MKQCICQICTCGRHRCEHTARRQAPYAKGDGGHLNTEHKERFKPFGFQPRQKPLKPDPSTAQWRGDEPTVKESVTKKDYVALPIQKRSLMGPKTSCDRKGGIMELSTTYQHDFEPKEIVPSRKAKVGKDCKDGTMPGTLPGKMEMSTTYSKSFHPKPTQKREKLTGKECTLTELGKPFQGVSETTSRFTRKPYSKRELAKPKKEPLKPEGGFEDFTTYKTDFTPKPWVKTLPARRPERKRDKGEKFQDETTHKHDYRCIPLQKRTAAVVPKPDIVKSLDSFKGKSHYKENFPPYQLPPKEVPPWHPSTRAQKKSLAPFEGETIYRTDYEAPPEEATSEKRKPAVRSNLTIPSGRMETLTTCMRDYRKVDRPVPTKSFKPDSNYSKPKDPFEGRSITRSDYTAKKAEKVSKSKAGDNLKSDGGPMENMTLTMKDYQWMTMDCPAIYLKLYGKDALPQFEFDKTEGGHHYFKKLKEQKLNRKVVKSKTQCSTDKPKN